MSDKPFIASDGALQLRDGSYRERFAYHYRDISTTQQFKATLRAGPYVWPGGYEVFLLCDDGATLCMDCARANFRNICDSINKDIKDGWRVIHCDTTQNSDMDNSLSCEHCNKTLNPGDKEESK